MGYRYRKSINLGGGVRLNLSKSGVGYSVGGKGYRYTHSPRGYNRTTYSLPGTGLSHVTQRSRSRGSTSASRQSAVAFQAPADPKAPRPPSAGLFASRYEKEFAAGVQQLKAGNTQAALEAFMRAAESDKENKAQADDLLVGLLHAQLDQVEQAIPALEKVIASDVALPDKLITKYLSQSKMSVTYAADMTAELPLDSVSAGVVLAECYRTQRRIDEAIGLLQQLATHRPDPHFFLALGELYCETDDYDDLDNLLEEPAVKTAPWDILIMLRSMHAEALIARDRASEAYAILESTWLAWFEDTKRLAILAGLCGLLLNAERYDAVIRIVTSHNVTNSDDDGFKLRLLAAQAMEKKGLDEAAIAVYKDLLQSKPRDPTKFATTIAQIEREERQRDPELLKEARYLRGLLYIKLGKKVMGNRDLSAVYAQDPTYRDVAQLLEA